MKREEEGGEEAGCSTDIYRRQSHSSSGLTLVEKQKQSISTARTARDILMSSSAAS